MTRGRIPIQRDEHVAIGVMLWKMQDDLITISDVVGAAYGVRPMDSVLRAERAIGSALVSLDTKFYREHPAEEINPYGWPQDRDIMKMARRDRRAELRHKATTVIEPSVAYVPPPERRHGKHLIGPLLFREHVVISNILVQMRLDLMHLFVNRLQYAYGKSDPTTERTRKAGGKLDRIPERARWQGVL